ncbi:MAG: VanZ family protein [Methylobacter sp.]
MAKILDFILLALYCLFIYWLSDQPKLPMPELFSTQDKLLHAGAYFIMGLLTWRSFKHVFGTPMSVALFSVVFCSLYGVSDEWHQSFVVGRTPAVSDWLADTIGAALAAFSLHRLGQSDVFKLYFRTR